MEPYRVEVSDAVLKDLDRRLAQVRWPDDLENADWSYGVQRNYLADLVQYWRNGYDWREQERRINARAHFRTTVNDIPIHFIHERGVGPAPMPLLLTHGWPWTFWDFHKLIGPLTDPAAHGGDPADAFDVIIPSLPGFGFSTPLRRTGIASPQVTPLWLELMDRLGYDRFAVHGGDWGAAVTADLGHRAPDRIIGVHLSIAFPLDFWANGVPGPETYAVDEQDRLEATQAGLVKAASHVAVQSADPQTIAYALHDSPVGLAAWILERRRSWSDCGGDVEQCFSKDDLLTTTMLYWVTDSMVSSMRWYKDVMTHGWAPAHNRRPVVEAPTAIALFPRELLILPQAWMEDYYNLQQVTKMPAGGHFAPMEQPELLVADIRKFMRPLRPQVAAPLPSIEGA